MGRWSPKHSREERDAVVRAQLQGLSAERAVQMAGDGELVPGLEPFEMSASRARELAQEARRRGQTAGRPPDELVEAARAVVAEVSRLGSRAKKTDLSRAQKAREIIRDAERDEPPDAPEDVEPSEFAKRLVYNERVLAEAEAEGKPAPCVAAVAVGGSNPEQRAERLKVCYFCGRPLDEHQLFHPNPLRGVEYPPAPELDTPENLGRHESSTAPCANPPTSPPRRSSIDGLI